jgi:hypothetical protein
LADHCVRPLADRVRRAEAKQSIVVHRYTTWGGAQSHSGPSAWTGTPAGAQTRKKECDSRVGD